MTIGERGVQAVVDSEIHAGQAPGHRARHIIDGSDWAATARFCMLAEDWFASGTFPDHPRRGIE